MVTLTLYKLVYLIVHNDLSWTRHFNLTVCCLLATLLNSLTKHDVVLLHCTGVVSVCGHWPCGDVRRRTCLEHQSWSELPSVPAKEKLAECASSLYKEHHGEIPASVLDN